MKILLSNDDGLNSPALLPSIRMLERIGEVTVVIPRHQQSWTSKSNTRRSNGVKKEIHNLDGRDVLTLEALPADCSNYGIYMNETLPDLVVSGANIGHNVGVSALFSSGTVGAALEGLFAKIPSIAISVPYEANSALTQGPFEDAIYGFEKFIKLFTEKRPDDVGLAMINLPYGSRKKELYATHLSNFHYGRLFEDNPNDPSEVLPVPYPDLSYPGYHEGHEGSDLWAREHKHGSVVFMDWKGGIVDCDRMQFWLKENGLIRIGE